MGRRTFPLIVGIAMAAMCAPEPAPAGKKKPAKLKPAFSGQTGAPEVTSKTKLEVTEIARGFDHPWAIAFLPDGRMLVTEKPTGKLFIVTAEGKKSAAVAGLPKVDGR